MGKSKKEKKEKKERKETFGFIQCWWVGEKNSENHTSYRAYWGSLVGMHAFGFTWYTLWAQESMESSSSCSASSAMAVLWLNLGCCWGPVETRCVINEQPSWLSHHLFVSWHPCMWMRYPQQQVPPGTGTVPGAMTGPGGALADSYEGVGAWGVGRNMGHLTFSHLDLMAEDCKWYHMVHLHMLLASLANRVLHCQAQVMSPPAQASWLLIYVWGVGMWWWTTFWCCAWNWPHAAIKWGSSSDKKKKKKKLLDISMVLVNVQVLGAS